ncbi:hypothetical protein ACP4OV_024669 [Aristida adscensionis]
MAPSSSSARRLFLIALVASIAVADAWGGFFGKNTAAVETEKAVTTTVPEAADPSSSAPEFSRPSAAAGGGRGYGLYGRPEENYPPSYFRRGVHHNAEKLTTATDVPATATDTEAAVVPARGGGGDRAEPVAEDNGSGRGRPPYYYAYADERRSPEKLTTATDVPERGGGERAEPSAEDNGSGRGRPPYYYAYTGYRGSQKLTPATAADIEAASVPARGGGETLAEDYGSGRGRPPYVYAYTGSRGQDERRYYGMSDTRVYQNGRYYYDVDTGRYGYGRESNPVRTRPEELGSGSGAGDGRWTYAGDGRWRYDAGDAAGYEYGNGDEFKDTAAAEHRSRGGFQENQNERYIP